MRRELLLAIGLVACSTDEASDGSESGSGGSEGSSDASSDASTGGTTVASDPSDTSSATGATTAPPSWPDPPWCGLPPPDDARAPRPCDGAISLVQTNTDIASGWISCTESGGMHREAVVDCVIPEGSVGTCNPDTAEAPECTMDAECDAAPNGVCNSMLEGMFGPETCGCFYPCGSDADCADGETCFCAGASSYCVTAYCETDADCEDGYHCWLNGNIISCDTPFDTCSTSLDCNTGDCPYCEYQADLCASQCVTAEACTAGRPFLVHGEARRASLRSGVVVRSGVDDLDTPTRLALARWWGDCGLAEHASVAAFARFALQLMSLGAPADLLADTAQAMRDEVEHARLCFALASRYGGTTVGPGPLDTAGALTETIDLVAVAELVAREACVDETLAALEAAECLAHASDPQVRSALERIAADELRHAALGWRFLAWALDRTDAGGRARIEAAVVDAIASAHARAAVASDRTACAGHGLLADDDRRALTRRGLADVVAPLASRIARSHAAA